MENNLTPEQYLHLLDEFNKYLDVWINLEKKLTINSDMDKLRLLSRINFRAIYTEKYKDLIKTILSDMEGVTNFASRIADLHVELNTTFPSSFINILKEKLFNAILEVDKEHKKYIKIINKEYPYLWVIYYLHLRLKYDFRFILK